MKAWILNTPAPVDERPLTAVESPVPTPSEDELLLRVCACGVCRTDLHIVEGELPVRRSPLIPGHQIVGEVIAGGSADIPPGTRVGVSWIGGVDGTCAYCRSGVENLCDSPVFTGYSVD